MKPPVPFDYDIPDPETPPAGLREPETPPATNRISGEQDKRFQALLRAKKLTYEDVFWLVCGDKCPTCEVTRPVKDHLTRLSKLTAFAEEIVCDHDHNHRSRGSVPKGQCDGPGHCLSCSAEEALRQ